MEKKTADRRWKVAGVLFAIYLASFGVLVWADNHNLLGRPASAFITVPYAPLIIFYNQVGRLLKGYW